jgi:hypothetical protein
MRAIEKWLELKPKIVYEIEHDDDYKIFRSHSSDDKGKSGDQQKTIYVLRKKSYFYPVK